MDRLAVLVDVADGAKGTHRVVLELLQMLVDDTVEAQAQLGQYGVDVLAVERLADALGLRGHETAHFDAGRRRHGHHRHIVRLRLEVALKRIHIGLQFSGSSISPCFAIFSVQISIRLIDNKLRTGKRQGNMM